MNDELEYFLSQDGLRLYYRHWDCNSPQSMVCIVHGLAEHSGRYEHVAQWFVSQGITVFALDLRGHGVSWGKRGHAKSYELLLSDVEEFLKTARATYTDLPMFLMGHSLGGNIVANFVLTKPVNELKGFMLSSPWFKLAFEPPAWKEKLAHFVSGFWPSLTQPDGLDASDLSRDKEEVLKYQSDPLIHGLISSGLYTSVISAGDNVLESASEIKLKGLVFHGDADRVVSCEASEAFANKNELVEWKVIKGAYHEALNDFGKEDLIAYLADWINSKR